MYSFMQQTFIKHLPYAQPYARHLASKKRTEHTNRPEGATYIQICMILTKVTNRDRNKAL